MRGAEVTAAEFRAWAAHTDRCRRGWQRDEVAWRNRGELLLYHGGEDGTYVHLEGVTVEVGRYQGAVPHIGEAAFRPVGRRAFTTPEEAYGVLMGACGTGALLASLGYQP